MNVPKLLLALIVLAASMASLAHVANANGVLRMYSGGGARSMVFGILADKYIPIHDEDTLIGLSGGAWAVCMRRTFTACTGESRRRCPREDNLYRLHDNRRLQIWDMGGLPGSNYNTWWHSWRALLQHDEPMVVGANPDYSGVRNRKPQLLAAISAFDGDHEDQLICQCGGSCDLYQPRTRTTHHHHPTSVLREHDGQYLDELIGSRMHQMLYSSTAFTSIALPIRLKGIHTRFTFPDGSHKTIGLRDAGITCNIPLPLSARLWKPVAFSFDASDESEPHDALRSCIPFWQTKGITATPPQVVSGHNTGSCVARSTVTKNRSEGDPYSMHIYNIVPCRGRNNHFSMWHTHTITNLGRPNPFGDGADLAILREMSRFLEHAKDYVNTLHPNNEQGQAAATL